MKKRERKSQTIIPVFTFEFTVIEDVFDLKSQRGINTSKFLPNIFPIVIVISLTSLLFYIHFTFAFPFTFVFTFTFIFTEFLLFKSSFYLRISKIFHPK